MNAYIGVGKVDVELGAAEVAGALGEVRVAEVRVAELSAPAARRPYQWHDGAFI